MMSPGRFIRAAVSGLSWEKMASTAAWSARACSLCSVASVVAGRNPGDDASAALCWSRTARSALRRLSTADPTAASSEAFKPYPVWSWPIRDADASWSQLRHARPRSRDRMNLISCALSAAVCAKEIVEKTLTNPRATAASNADKRFICFSFVSKITTT